MRIIKPVAVTPAVLTSSNVPETDWPQWLVGSAYAVGDKVIRGHKIYEALVAHTGADPATDTSDPPKWLDLGATNRWRMFDDKVGTLTKQAGSVSVELTPGAVINSLAMFNVQGTTVDVTLTDPVDGIVYSKTVQLVDAGVANWYDWFFLPIGKQTDLVLLDLPAYGTATLTVTVNSPTGDAAVGSLLIGSQVELGVAVYGSGVGIIDYSRKTTDDFGNTSVVQRAFSKRAEFDVVVDTQDVGRILRVLSGVRGTPVVWIGEASYESTIVYGYYRDFAISIAGPSVSDATITVEGLI